MIFPQVNPWDNNKKSNPQSNSSNRNEAMDVLKFLQSPKYILLALLVMLVLWILSGFYRVLPDERGIELLFGKYNKTTLPGLNYWFPMPIGDVIRPKVTTTNQISIGGTQGRSESLILTSDQNIIDINFDIYWKIAEDHPEKFLFNINNPPSIIASAGQSVMREVIGQMDLNSIMTERRNDAQILAKENLQQILNTYDAGVEITEVKLQRADPPEEVIDSFNEVQRARQDKERLQNQALAYANGIIPRAKGEASKIISEAMAIKERLIIEAKGEAKRFEAVYETYRMNPTLTYDRIYLERISEIFKGKKKFIIQNGNNILPLLPLDGTSSFMNKKDPILDEEKK